MPAGFSYGLLYSFLTKLLLSGSLRGERIA
jgi:hypothetical protein